MEIDYEGNEILFSNIKLSNNSKENVLELINCEEFKNIFLENGITNVIIFGSLANGDFSEESDIDIAVIGNKKIDFDVELKITLKIEKLLDRNIDIIDIIDINDNNINNIIKIEVLRSNMIILSDIVLEDTLYKFEKLYRENEEFWYLLDKEVLDSE